MEFSVNLSKTHRVLSIKMVKMVKMVGFQNNFGFNHKSRVLMANDKIFNSFNVWPLINPFVFNGSLYYYRLFIICFIHRNPYPFRWICGMQKLRTHSTIQNPLPIPEWKFGLNEI